MGGGRCCGRASGGVGVVRGESGAAGATILPIEPEVAFILAVRIDTRVHCAGNFPGIREAVSDIPARHHFADAIAAVAGDGVRVNKAACFHIASLHEFLPPYGCSQAEDEYCVLHSRRNAFKVNISSCHGTV